MKDKWRCTLNAISALVFCFAKQALLFISLTITQYPADDILLYNDIRDILDILHDMYSLFCLPQILKREASFAKVGIVE